MGFFDDIGLGFVEDAADAVVDVVDDVVGGVADAVGSIPVVGDIVETVAPFGGLIGTAIGGPIGGAIGGMVGGSFDDDDGGGGGGMFGFLDTAIDAVGGALPGPIGDIAGGLIGGGSLIDPVGSLLGAAGVPSVGGVVGGLLGGEGLPDLGGLTDVAGGLLGGAGGLGGLGGLLDAAGDVGGLGSVLESASSVFGGLGLGGLGSAAQGIIGDVVPGLSDPGGWLGNLPDVLSPGSGGVDLPFGLGSLPSVGDIVGPISEAGGGWLEQLGEQIGEVTDAAGQLGIGDLITNCWGNIPGQIDVIGETIGDTIGTAGSGLGDTFDDLIGQLPGVEGANTVQDAMQQLLDSGGLGQALEGLSSNDLTQLVTRLVTPVTEVGEAAADTLGVTTGELADTLGVATGELADSASEAFGSMDVDDVGAATDLATSAEGFDDDLGLSIDAPAAFDDGGVADLPDVAMPEPEPEPTAFSQSIDQANAVEESFDDMFDGLE